MTDTKLPELPERELEKIAAELDQQPVFSSTQARALWYASLSERIRTALSAIAARQEGFVLVPREPTDEMLRAAACRKADFVGGPKGWLYGGIYRAMIAAAQKAAGE